MKPSRWTYLGLSAAVALATFLVTMLLININQRQREARAGGRRTVFQQFARAGENRSGCGRERQRLPVAIDDGTAHGSQLHRGGMFLVRERGQPRPVDQHQHRQTHQRKQEQSGERESQRSDTQAALFERLIHGTITT